MKEVEEYRTNLLNSLQNTAKAFRDECLAVPEPYAPMEAGGWNVHQVAAHTRDVHKFVYSLRVRQTAQEENPEFFPFDGKTFMAEHYDAQEPLSELLNSFVQHVETLVEELRVFPPQVWSRVSRHTNLGRGITLQRWVEKDLAHIKEHLEEVQRNKIKSKTTKE